MSAADEFTLHQDAALLQDIRWLEELARRLSRDPELAKDACQSVWLDWQRRPELRGDRSLLARALRQTLWLMRRGDQRRRAREQASAREDWTLSPEQLIARGEERERTWRALVKLAPEYRQLLLLRFAEGLSPREIADELELKTDTVRWRLRRGIELLRESMGVQLPEVIPSERRAWAIPFLSGLQLRRTSALKTFLGSSSPLITKTILMSKTTLGALALSGLALLLTFAYYQVDGGDELPETEIAALDGEANEPDIKRPANTPPTSPSQEDAGTLQPAPTAFQGLITGRVLERDEFSGRTRLLEGARVVSFRRSGRRWETTTDAEGRFRLRVPPPEGKNLWISVEAGEFQTRLTRRIDPGRFLRSPERPQLLLCDLGELTLAPACVIVASCIDTSGNPIAGALLSVNGLRWILPKDSEENWESDAQGRWRMSRAPVGRHELSIAAAGFADLRREVELPPGRIITLPPFILDAAATVRGLVTDLLESPLPDATIRTRLRDPSWRFPIDEYGFFEARVPDMSSVRVWIEAPGFEPLEGEPVEHPDEHQVFRLRTLGQRCRIRAIDSESGRPVSTLELTLHREQSGFDSTGAKSARIDGAHVFYAQLDEDEIEVRAEGYHSQRLVVNAAFSAEEGALVELVPLVSSLHGRIVDADDRPIAGARVTLLRGPLNSLSPFDDDRSAGPKDRQVERVFERLGARGHISCKALDSNLPTWVLDPRRVEIVSTRLSDAEGRYEFDVHASDVLIVVAEAENSQLQGRSGLITQDLVDSNLGDLLIEAPASLSGRIISEGGESVEGHEISIGDRHKILTRSDANGAFTFPRLRAGWNLLNLSLRTGRLSSRSERPPYFAIDLVPGEEREIEIRLPASPLRGVEAEVRLNGQPASKRRLRALDEEGSEIGETTLDTSGRGRIELIPGARFSLELESESGTLVSELMSRDASDSSVLRWSPETFHLEVSVARSSIAERPDLYLLYRLDGTIGDLRAARIQRLGDRSVFRFDHVPIAGRDLELFVDGSETKQWSLELDEDLHDLPRPPGRSLRIEIERP